MLIDTTAPPSTLALLCASYLVAYLICGIPFALIISQLFLGVDIRTRGSGNVGSTNALRELGLKWGVLTFVLDTLKGALSCWAAMGLAVCAHHFFTLNATHLLACVCGHIFSIYLKGRGGKGIATGLGAGLVVCPIPTITALIVFIAVVCTSRLVSLASLSATITLFFAYLYFFWPIHPAQAVAVLITCTAVIWAHRTNIRRLINKTEQKLGKSS